MCPMITHGIRLCFNINTIIVLFNAFLNKSIMIFLSFNLNKAIVLNGIFLFPLDPAQKPQPKGMS